jgi:Fe2+ or Zn2+ uptake regulation protein
MDFFRELGLVHASEVRGVTVYELAHNGEPNGHLICDLCGGVEHVPGALFESLAQLTQSAHGFAADLSTLSLHGVCDKCSSGTDA